MYFSILVCLKLDLLICVSLTAFFLDFWALDGWSALWSYCDRNAHVLLANPSLKWGWCYMLSAHFCLKLLDVSWVLVCLARCRTGQVHNNHIISLYRSPVNVVKDRVTIQTFTNCGFQSSFVSKSSGFPDFLRKLRSPRDHRTRESRFEFVTRWETSSLVQYRLLPAGKPKACANPQNRLTNPDIVRSVSLCRKLCNFGKPQKRVEFRTNIDSHRTPARYRASSILNWFEQLFS